MRSLKAITGAARRRAGNAGAQANTRGVAWTYSGRESLTLVEAGVLTDSQRRHHMALSNPPHSHAHRPSEMVQHPH